MTDIQAPPEATPPKVIDLPPTTSMVQLRALGGPDARVALVPTTGSPATVVLPPSGDADIALSVPAASGETDAIWTAEMNETVREVSRVSRELLVGSTAAAQEVSARLRTSTKQFTLMLWATFALGCVALLAAVLRGFTADDASEVWVTGVFGGMSTAAFVTTFISRPTGAMGEVGPRSAWVQAIVTTYWSKLAYMSDPASVLRDLDDAQQSFGRAMQDYLRATTGSPGDVTATVQNPPSPQAPQPDDPPTPPPGPEGTPS